ncbi:ribosomal RNA small subunit methyltransferase A [Paenibacillus sp. J23TS9]|uniref:23S ribosomal RNA methyltransferase Erm n=1 Tax=Paenibacillus sp. J23TS9 TaxID=2807193 RepID=UPI001B22AEA0|nr:23S ribosomal RNA methyltransferase Erm [Paenibacillus sp. J23TS9]GIP30190.1 ribosomal RNA small subunit methyltransferase A [Paenibacillus sp. J23TS9]
MHRQDQRLPKTKTGDEKSNLRAQHLLHNKRIVQEMVEHAGIQSIDIVVDLGAGKGAITWDLAEKAGKVVAIENDPAYAEALRRKSEAFSNVMIIERDIREAYLPKEPFHVVANIPFFITTPILDKLMDPPGSSFQGAVMLIQHGAAKGFTARLIRNPRLLKWRMWFDMELVKVVPKYHFSPPPSVDAAILRIRRKEDVKIALHHHHAFEGLAEYGLKYPELPVYEALKGIFTTTQMKHLVRNLRADRHAPICTLNELQWGVVFHAMQERVPAFRWPIKLKKNKP